MIIYCNYRIILLKKGNECMAAAHEVSNTYWHVPDIGCRSFAFPDYCQHCL